jgi:hypothetical protein
MQKTPAKAGAEVHQTGNFSNRFLDDLILIADLII